MMMKNNKLNNQTGFSLIEMIVVASLFIIGFVGVSALIEQSVKMKLINQNYLTAIELAKEGIELTRYVRNDNWLRAVEASRSDSLSFANNLNDTNNNGAAQLFTIDYRIIGSDYVDRAKYLEKFTSTDSLYRDVKNQQAQLYYQTDANANQFYIINKNINTEEPSQFHRLIKTIYHNNGTIDDDSDDFLQIIAMVYWQEKGRDRYYSLSTYLYNYDWYYK